MSTRLAEVMKVARLRPGVGSSPTCRCQSTHPDQTHDEHQAKWDAEGWDLDARLARESMARQVAAAKPVCRQLLETGQLTDWDLMALSHAVLACVHVITVFDATHDRELPMPRSVAGLIDVLLWVRKKLDRAEPAQGTLL